MDDALVSSVEPTAGSRLGRALIDSDGGAEIVPCRKIPPAVAPTHTSAKCRGCVIEQREVDADWFRASAAAGGSSSVRPIGCQVKMFTM